MANYLANNYHVLSSGHLLDKLLPPIILDIFLINFFSDDDPNISLRNHLYPPLYKIVHAGLLYICAGPQLLHCNLYDAQYQGENYALIEHLILILK